MSGMIHPSAYRKRTSAVAGVTLWTRVTDGSTSWILPDGCIDVLWNGRELTVAGRTRRPIAPTRQLARPTRRCARLGCGLGRSADGLQLQLLNTLAADTA